MENILKACKAIQEATNDFKPEVGIILGTGLGSYCDVIGVRSFARFENKKDDYEEKILQQFIQYSGKPVFAMETATVHPLQAFADLITIFAASTVTNSARHTTKFTSAVISALPNSFPSTNHSFR